MNRRWFDTQGPEKVLPPIGETVICLCVGWGGEKHAAYCRRVEKKVLGLFTVTRWELVRWANEYSNGAKLRKVIYWRAAKND